jgi:uncharacterized BrkB/YihY/UPF0761 family membrane protein
MRIDISLLVRVMYQPSRTFGVFLRGPNFEALLPVLAIAVLAAISSYLESPQREVAGGFGLVVGLLAAVVYIMVLMVLQPALNAMWVFVLRRYVGRSPNIGFSVLFTAFILCALPMYVGFLLEFVSRTLHFRFVDAYHSLGDTHPFLYGVLATFTPYFAWTAVLWWIAVDVLLQPRALERRILVASLVLLDSAIGGVLSGALSRLLRE